MSKIVKKCKKISKAVKNCQKMSNIIKNPKIMSRINKTSQHDELEPNLKKIPTETEYGVWKLLSCSFTYQSQKNPFP